MFVVGLAVEIDGVGTGLAADTEANVNGSDVTMFCGTD